MNDIRRTILWVIFGFSLVLLWDKWQLHNGRQATFFPSPQPAAQVAQTSADATPAAITSASSASSTDVPDQNKASSTAPREHITVRSDVLELTFDTQGGTLTRATLLGVDDDERTGNPFVLFDESPSRVYLAQTGLIGTDGLPNHKTPMRLVTTQRELVEGQDTLEVRFEAASKSGVRLTKTYTLRRGDYAVAVAHTVSNDSGAAIAPQLYLQLMRDGNPVGDDAAFYSTFTGPAFYSDEAKFQKIDFSDIEKGKADFQKTTTTGYIAMVQHYFASAWILPSGQSRENFARKVDNNLYTAGTIAPFGTIAPGENKTLEATLFAGPQVEKTLEAITPGLELVKDYGILTILAKPLYWLLDKIHSVIGNWGWAIVGLVLLLKIAFYWLNAKAYSSMAQMKAIAPRIQDMRERLKDNPQQMQMEMMRIYREEKINPLGGCLPMLVQIPVFIALYWVLLSSVEIRHAPWIGWIADLSARDPYFILPLLMMLSSLLQVALNPVPPDPIQAKMMWFMPLVFGVMFFFFPAGLVLYWLTNNILSIAQQWIINVRMGVPPQFNLPNFKGNTATKNETAAQSATVALPKAASNAQSAKKPQGKKAATRQTAHNVVIAPTVAANDDATNNPTSDVNNTNGDNPENPPKS